MTGRYNCSNCLVGGGILLNDIPKVVNCDVLKLHIAYSLFVAVILHIDIYFRNVFYKISHRVYLGSSSRARG